MTASDSSGGVGGRPPSGLLLAPVQSDLTNLAHGMDAEHQPTDLTVGARVRLPILSADAGSWRISTMGPGALTGLIP